MKKYTDQEFLYRQTPVNYDGIAKFTSIKGNTLGWNQLVQNGNFVDTSGWTANVSPTVFTVSSNVATVIATSYAGGIWRNVALTTNHKYLEVFTINTNGKRVNVGSTALGSRHAITNTSATSYAFVSTASSTGNSAYVFYSNQAEETTMNIRNVMLIDLTQMYVSGNEPSADEFLSLFSLPYYDYNQGTLIPFSGNGIKTVGFNLFDQESVLTNVGFVEQSDGSFYIQYPSTAQNRVLFENKLKYSGQFFLVYKYKYVNTTSQGCRFEVHYTDGAVDQIYATGTNDFVEMSFLTRADKVLDYICATYGSNIGTWWKDVCINISDPSKDGTYEPYKEITTSLPISTYFPTGMKRAGNVYDELTENKAITRVGSRAYQSGDENNANYVTDGTTTYYPLATETETDIDTEIIYPFYGGGTEQILPVNGSTPTTAPIVADIVYYTKIDSNTPYRKFWLVNGNGDRWNLTEKELKSFLDSPQGLGFQKSIDVTRYGERAYKNTETYNFPQVSGDIFFYDTVNATRYEKYNEFVRFLMVQPLTLYYQIPVSIYSGIADIYTLDCEVINLTKTESKTNRVLTSNIQINGLGFYQGDTVEINGTSATVTINNDGDFPVGFEIEISGDLKNPYFTLEQDGELYGEAKFNDDSNNFSSVYVDSKDGEQNVVLKQNDSILPNPLAYQDLSISNGSVYVTFVKLEKGVSTLTIGDDNDSVSGYTIRFTPMYRSV